MRMASRFKSEAKWTAAVHYLPPVAGLLLILVALLVKWVVAAV
jgi:hypothetical protein